jgi:chromosome segregation ATPase
MGNRLWFFISLALIGGIGYRIYTEGHRQQELLDKIQSQANQIQDQQKHVAELEQKLQQAQGIVSAQKNSAVSELESLTNQMESEKVRLQALNQKISDLKNQLGGSDPDTQARLVRLKNLTADLEARLKVAQAAEKDVGQLSDVALKNTKAQVQYQTQTINTQIQGQDELIKATKDQLGFWRKQKGNVNQAAKVEEYQQQLAEQTQVLQQLRAQKISLAQANQNQSSEIKQEAGQEKETIKSSEAQLQDQLRRAQQDLKTLQEYQNSSQKSIDDVKNRIHQVQEAYNVEYAKYQTLQESLKKKQAEVDQLKKPAGGN